MARVRCANCSCLSRILPDYVIPHKRYVVGLICLALDVTQSVDYFALTSPSISNPSPPIHESSPPLLSARICTSRQSIRTSSPLTSLFYV
ncbi:DUF6431 domain-containing protein [Alkalibacterium sp. s-m-28]